MSHALSRRQAVVLGLVVVLAVAFTGGGLARIAARQGLWADTVELTVGLSEPHDVGPGTPVRVRGVDAGQVVAVEYPERDGPDAAVTVRMRVDAKFAGRLFADASARVHPTGLLGGKVIAVSPGTPAAGPLAGGKLHAAETQDVNQAVARLGAAADKIGAAADETAQLVQEARTGNGTLGKLIRDDDLYRDVKGLAADSREFVQRANGAVGKVEGQVANVEGFVKDGRETINSTKQTVDSVNQSWVGRQMGADVTPVLVRPTCRREARSFHAVHLFEPGTAVLTDEGREHLTNIANWVKEPVHDKAELVAVAQMDATDKGQTSASAAELTRKQTEAVVEFLKAHGAHKTGLISRRKMTAVGLGFGPSPVVERDPIPATYVQVVLFTPTSS